MFCVGLQDVSQIWAPHFVKSLAVFTCMMKIGECQVTNFLGEFIVDCGCFSKKYCFYTTSPITGVYNIKSNIFNMLECVTTID